MQRFEEIWGFVQGAGLGFTFGIADLFGITPPARGAWNSTNAESLLQYASDHGIQIDVLELGNEPTSCFSYTYSSELATRLSQLNDILTRVYGPRQDHSSHPSVATEAGGKMPRPMIAVPDIDPKYGSFIAELLNASSPLSAIDAITLHHYATESNLVTNLREPLILDNIVEPWGYVLGNTSILQPEILNREGLWLGETGPAGSSGRENLTDAFLSSLWYADSLGLTAALGGRRHHR